MATHARQQYFADESSLSKEKREFSIAEEVQQKIDSIEEGAQVNTIETIKVNGSEVQPDENKAVDLTIPGVVDSLDSTSSTDALSARQGKVLYDYIQDVSHIGHFLALWDASTGLPVTDPETSPYIYNTGDFYTVSVVASGGGTNYKPDGTQYVIGQASTAVDTDDVEVNDFYFYDGQVWRHMKNSGAGSIAVDGSLSTTSTNPVENRVITNALNNKADITDANTKTFRVTGTDDLAGLQAAYDYFVNGGWPIIIYGYYNTPYQGAYIIDKVSNVFQWSRTEQWYYSNSTESFVQYVKLRPQLSGNTVTGMQFIYNSDTGYLDLHTNYGAPYIPLYPGSPATKRYVDEHAGTTYTAGANIQISNENVISATDTTYTEGTGIDISNSNVISADTTVLATKSDLDEKQDKLTAGDNITIGDECYPNTKGPCQKGFHIGMQSEWRAMMTAHNNLGLTGGRYWIEYLHLPRTDDYDSNAYYWCADAYGSGTGSGSLLSFSQNGINTGSGQPTYLAHPIRPVKDTPEVPDSSWTVVYDGSSVASGAGIFYNATLGLISISSDGTTWYTIADKNLGATTVYNRGDARSQANCGNRFQWGNCYGFNWSGETVDSTTPVDTTGYGPGNYYYSDVFMGTPSDWSWDWSSPGNRNLWGGDNPTGTQCALTISAQVPEIEVDDEISSISENPVQNKVIKEALDEKVNLGVNKVFDNTVVEIGKWVQEQGSSSSGHNVTIDPNGEVSTYNVTTGGHNEATLGSANLTLLENTVLGGDETTVISQDGITVTEGQTTQTYNFLGNDRIAKLSDVSGVAADVNTKTFYLSSTSDLTTAQAILDWYNAGKNPIIVYNNGVKPNTYTIFNKTSTRIDFRGEETPNDTTDHTQLKYTLLTINFSGTTASSITLSTVNQNYLATDISYPSAYIPTYDSSPATKKYVDDNSTNTKTFQGYRGIGHLDNAQAVYDRISTGKYAIVEVKNGDNNWKGNVVFGPTDVTTGTISSWEYTHADQSSLSGGLYYEEYNKLVMQVADGVVTQAYSSGEVIHNNGHLVVKGDTAPSGPIEGSVWYDTTNDKLKIYNGTNWNEVGSGTGDMLYADFNWQAKTGTAITLDLTSTITPTANFTVNAPSTIKDGQTYILRVNNGATAYTMTLGTNITNPYQESTLLTADGIDQFVFLAIGGNLELQPSDSAATREYVESINGTSGPVTLKTINSTSIVGSGNIAVQPTLSTISASTIKTGTSTTKYAVTAAGLAGGLVRISSAENNILANGGKLWAGTQEDYEALTSYDEDTVYLTI